jgi:RNA polymerase sigma-70 factor, ECF subfamily
MSEKDLVEKAQSGDFDAFNTLIEKYKTKIYQLALKMSRNQEDAEDILQETFLKAVDNIDKFRAESSFGTWLYTIAVNVVRAQYAKDKRMDLSPIEEYLPSGHGDNSASGKLFDWGDPHEILERKELKSAIENMLADMPPKYSMPFVLRYYEDMSIDEVAKAMDLSIPATKSRVLRARLALREQLSDVFQEKIDERM